MSHVHLLIEAAAQTYIHIQSVEVTLEGADFCSSYSTPPPGCNLVILINMHPNLFLSESSSLSPSFLNFSSIHHVA